MPFERFVTLGDSCAEGLDDPYPDGSRYRGWADLVAERLADEQPGLRYANLAVRGRRLDQIVAEQMPVAKRLRPDFIALFGGGNDVMSGGWSDDEIRRRVDTAVGGATEIAPTVAVFTLSDISRRMPLGRRLGPRITVLNEAITAAAEHYGALLVDIGPDPAVHDLRYFGRDRLHLSHHGHRRLAAHLLTVLGVSTQPSWLEPLPGPPPQPGVRGHAAWLWREVRPVAISRVRNRLIGRSPGDGFLPKQPDLLPVRPV
ncbi:SGNH/GDSL hydrolase family protein [Amycolatopsis suaedae]|uniref:SGNH/GDSL hydrolase family protein n=1 Tax=Amycolatopsis suaedae TaxID=2510978 RepID=A0A4Q7JB33_9PSEU|nr:SGNH/GDSL hydrolase family protein [Amycolatopsis suaedae]RZQ63444.1 SGNH/GDSL hydrolase family protein [Amycolatopsis suaedae]